MKVVDTTQINSFAPIAAQTNFVQPSEEAVFILTACQLKDLIKEAIQPLQDEVSQLRATVDRLEKKTASLETTQEHDMMSIGSAWTSLMIANASRGWSVLPRKSRGRLRSPGRIRSRSI